MRRCIVYLCVFLALTACSPKSISGERAVRTSSTIERVDSSSMKSWLEKAVRETMGQQLVTDSTTASSVMGEAFTEDKRRMSGNVSGWMPWYVYLAGLVGALLVGLVLAVRGNKWSKMKLK